MTWNAKWDLKWYQSMPHSDNNVSAIYLFQSLWNTFSSSGAIVRVTCYYSTRNPVSMAITTGKKGFFYLTWPNVVKFSPKKCRAYLGWSPFSFCKLPIYHNGSISAPIEFNGVRNMTRGLQAMYSAGVLLYGPTANNKLCHVP